MTDQLLIQIEKRLKAIESYTSPALGGRARSMG